MSADSYNISMTSRPEWKASVAQKFFKTLAKTLLRRLCGPRTEIVALECRRELRRRPEELPRLVVSEAREPGRFQIGGAAVGSLDQVLQRFGQLCGKAEAQMNCSEQSLFHDLVAVADHRFERRDHVADDVFRRVVQQNRETSVAIEPRGLGPRQRLHQQGVLRDGKNVGSLGLPVPAGNAGQSVRDILQFEVERGGVEQIEAPPRKHAL